MTITDFATLLSGIGMPATYRAFPTDGPPPDMPFLTYQEVGTANFAADNKVYMPSIRLQVSLFTQKRDLQAQALVETAFDDNDIFWERTPDEEPDETCYRTIYDVTI